jgi:DNA-binding MarR family transcriptional regulator
MKKELLNFIQELMKANPELTEKLMTDDIKAYLDAFSDNVKEKPEVTENGKAILKYMQDNPDVRLWKSKDLAEQMGSTSRIISGALRKLVNDGFCDKLGENPVIYSLADKGKNYIIED